MPDEVNSVLPEPGPSAGFSPAATPQDFGSGVGAALGEAGEVATRLHHDTQAQARQTMALDASNQMEQWLNANVYHPTDGVLNKPTGKDAAHAVDDTLARYDEQVSNTESRMPDPQARESFLRSAQVQRQTLTRELYRYEDTQFKGYSDQVDKATIGNAVTAAVRSSADPDEVGFQIAKQQAVLAQAARRNGTPPEMLQLQQAEVASSTHMAVLTHLSSSGQDQRAQAYYQEHQQEFTAKDGDRAAALVKAGSTLGAAQQASDRILAGAKDLDGAMAQVREIQDPELREHTQAMVEHGWHVQQEAVEQASNARFERVKGQLLQNGWDLGKLSGTDWAGLTPDQKITAQQLCAKDGKVETDWGYYYKLQQDLVNPQTRTAAAQSMDPSDMARHLGPVEMKEMGKLRAEVLAPDQAKSPRLPGIESREQIISRSLAEVGIDPRPYHENPDGTVTTNADSIAFRRQLQARVDAIQGDTGKPIDDTQLQQQIDTLLKPQSITHPGEERAWYNPARWFGSSSTAPTTDTVRTFRLPHAGDLAYTPTQIPTADRQRIEGEFADAGLRPTPQQVTDLYNRGVLGQRTAADPMTDEDWSWWKATLANPSSPDYPGAIAKLRRWSSGVSTDGYVEPALIQKYRDIAKQLRGGK